MEVNRFDIRPQNSVTANPDRKSTRLNSSHLGISYAVFCLKKKKKKNIHRCLARLHALSSVGQVPGTNATYQDIALEDSDSPDVHQLQPRPRPLPRAAYHAT